MENKITRSMYSRTSNRKQSVSEKDKPSKKGVKKKKKTQKCWTTSVEGVDQERTESDRSQQSHSAEITENNGNVSRFPVLHQADRKTSAKGTAGECLAVSPCVGNSGTVMGSRSVNTDLSESTISLLSSSGNSQTDLPAKALVSRAYCTPVETLIQSVSGLSVKTKSPNLKSDSPRNSRTSKSQQRSQGRSNSVRKSSGTGKYKISNSAHYSKSGNQKLKQVDERTENAFCRSVFNSESQRWELEHEDLVQEAERLNLYKINRRKRYIAAAEAKGLHWASEYNENGDPKSPSEEIIYGSKRGIISPEGTSPTFSTVQSLAPVTVHTVRGKLIVEC